MKPGKTDAEPKTSRRFKAAVLGLGKIGQGFDYDRSDDSVIATHASGYARHPGYELVGGVDPDLFQRKRFEAKFQVPAYPDLRSLMEQQSPDVFSIAVPAERHLTVFMEIMRYKPVAVLCEKPIATNSEDGKRMQSLAEQQQCVLAVNYMRRFEPGSLKLKRIIETEELGSVFKGVVWYSKGLLNNASHFIDLVRFWLGTVKGVNVMEEGRKWDGLDPEPDFCLRFNDTPVYFLSGREECFSVGEVNLFCSGGNIRYADFGNLIELCRTYPSPLLEGYTILGPDREMIKTDLKRYQIHVLEGLYRHLISGDRLESDGKSGVETLQVIERITNDFKRGQNE